RSEWTGCQQDPPRLQVEDLVETDLVRRADLTLRLQLLESLHQGRGGFVPMIQQENTHRRILYRESQRYPSDRSRSSVSLLTARCSPQVPPPASVSASRRGDGCSGRHLRGAARG